MICLKNFEPKKNATMCQPETNSSNFMDVFYQDSAITLTTKNKMFDYYDYLSCKQLKLQRHIKKKNHILIKILTIIALELNYHLYKQ